MLLFVDMTNLEPNVRMRERVRWITQNPIKALEALLVFALLFVYDT